MDMDIDIDIDHQLAILEYKYEELYRIFYSSDTESRSEYEQSLYDSIFSIGIEKIGNIKDFLTHLINKGSFEYNKSTFENITIKESYENKNVTNILIFIWTNEVHNKIIKSFYLN